MDYIDYREKLGLSFSDSDKQKLFIKRIHTLLLMKYQITFHEAEEIQFCYEVGIQTWMERQKTVLGNVINFDEPKGMRKLFFYLDDLQDNFIDFLAALVVFLNLFPCNSEIKKSLLENIELALRDSHIQYELLDDSGKTFIFPKGAKELDRALVSEPLEWLSSYQTSQKAFSKALELYADSSDSNASDVADAFRKSLETFFQEFFNSDKSLENLKSEYGQFLKNCNVPAEISNNFQSLLNSYALFMNNYAKHHDKTSKNILEYIMYQTGNIIRLLITLKNEAERLRNE